MERDAVGERHDLRRCADDHVRSGVRVDVGADEGSAAAGEAGRADGRPGLAGEAADQAWR